jgi:sulfite exporter TauE/SafE
MSVLVLAPGALLAAFAAGLFSAPHCLGMCGTLTAACGVRGPARAFAANGTRVLSYACGGALVGLLGQGALELRAMQPLFMGLAGAFTVALGLVVAGWLRVPAAVEAAGAKAWARLSPLLRPLVPVRSVAQAAGFGLLWGWVPCGLVYAALVLALLQGTAAGGASIMLAFGLGTALHLIPAGALAGRIQAMRKRSRLRIAAGLAMAALGTWTVAHAAGNNASPIFSFGGLFCVAPVAAR